MGPLLTLRRQVVEVSPYVKDGALVLAFLAMRLLPPLTLEECWEGPCGDFGLLGWILAVLSVGPLVLRRRFPLSVLATLTLAEVAWGLLDYAADLVQSLPALVATYAVATSAHRLPVRLLAFLSPSLILVIGLGWYEVDLLPVLFMGTLFVFVFVVGVNVRSRREYAGQLEEQTKRLEQAQAMLAERAVAEERSRIARELHDIVAHAMSVITVQAGVGAHVAPERPDKATEALRVIEATGREALEEMRRLLGVLRGEPGGGDEAPQPGLEDLPALVSQMNESGVDVSLQVQGDARSVPTSLGLSAYRVAQEALTNAAKHAAGSPVRLAVSYQPRTLVVEVEDQGGEPTALVGSGLGVVGMKERVALFSGSLEAGSLPDGGFRVRARFPIDGLVG